MSNIRLLPLAREEKMRKLVWTLVLLMAAVTFQLADGGGKWSNRFGIGQKPSQPTQTSPSTAVSESPEPPLAMPPVLTPGSTADSQSKPEPSNAPTNIRVINGKHIIVRYRMK